jgi:hypothetical protein
LLRITDKADPNTVERETMSAELLNLAWFLRDRKSSMKLSGAQRRRIKAQDARHKQKRKRLSLRITLQQVAEFSARLVPINYGSGSGCWIYPSKGSTGASGSYAYYSFNGVQIGPHRFALAVKLGCTLWDLDGFDAAHSSKEICVGGRCCNPDHLYKKRSEPNRSWDRAKDAARYGNTVVTRTEPQARKLLAAMYPMGLVPNSSLFDEPWQQNVSPELTAFLENGIRGRVQKGAFASR